MPTTTNNKTHERENRILLFLALIGIVMTVGLLLYVVPALTNQGGRGAAPQLPNRLDAFVACKEFVRDQLRAPATANFGGVADTTMSSADGRTWIVRGWVDSQNAFGAMLRSDYSCTTQLTGDQWQRINLTVTPR